MLLRAMLLWLLLALAPAIAAEAPAELIRRADAATRSDPEASRRLAEEALRQLATQPDADLQLRAHLLLCDYHSERDRERAQRHADEARQLLPQVKRAGLRAALLGCEGDIRENAGDNARAMALYEQSVAAAEAAHDEEFLANALFQRGYLRGVQGELAQGLADLRRAFAIYDRLKLTQHLNTTLNSIATLYDRLGDHAQARQYYEATLAAQREAGLTREQVVTLHNLGRTQEAAGDQDAASRSFEDALALARQIGYPRGEAYALRGLASVANARGAPAEALRLLAQADAGSGSDERLRAQILLQRGIALRLARHPAESVTVLSQALAVFQRADSTAEASVTHGELARALTDLNDWRDAYAQEVLFKSTSDSLLQRQLDQRFASLKVEFDTAAKERENALLLRENAATERALDQQRRANRLQGAVLALAGLLAAVLAMLAWRHRRDSRRMQALAMTDELTGLPNRRHALERLQSLLAPPRAGCAVLIADIDRFKSVNDEHGHLVGDQVLRAVALALRECARDPVLIGRLGGEEFVVVLPDADGPAARQFAERLRAEVGRLDVSRWLPGRRLSISVGATTSRPGDDVGKLLKRADDALYAAKAGGRDRTVVAAPAHGDALAQPA